jgi:hypothetical protein
MVGFINALFCTTYIVDADLDSTYHPDVDQDSDFLFVADPVQILASKKRSNPC